MVNEKIIKFRVKPYYQESGLQLIIDILVSFLIWIGFMLFPGKQAHEMILYFSIMTVMYILIALYLNYRSFIQAFVDKWQKALLLMMWK